MKIYRSTEYIDVKNKSGPWYQLKVINLWDAITKPICSRSIDGKFIMYSLEIHTPISNISWSTDEVKVLSENMKTELIKMKYTIL